MRRNLDKRYLLLAAGLGGTLVASSHATLIDTFNRADGADPSNSLGSTETGTYTYTYGERGENPLTTSQNPSQGTAEISATGPTAASTGSQLRITGFSSAATRNESTVSSNPGEAYLTNYNSADSSIKADISFDNFDNSAANTSGAHNTDPGTNFITSYAIMVFRSQANATAGASASDVGQIIVGIAPNGDQTVREVQNNGGVYSLAGLSINSAYTPNPFTPTSTSVTRKKLTSSSLLTNFHGIDIDTNGDGFIDNAESINYTATVSGTTVTTFLDGYQVGQWTTQNTSGVNNNLIALGKDRRSSADTYVSDVYYDNLDVTPLSAPTPEPSCVAALAGMGGILAARRRHRA